MFREGIIYDYSGIKLYTGYSSTLSNSKSKQLVQQYYLYKSYSGIFKVNEIIQDIKSILPFFSLKMKYQK